MLTHKCIAHVKQQSTVYVAPGHAWGRPPCCFHHFAQNNGPDQRSVALAVSGMWLSRG